MYVSLYIYINISVLLTPIYWIVGWTLCSLKSCDHLLYYDLSLALVKVGELKGTQGCPGGSLVKNPPVNTRDKDVEPLGLEDPCRRAWQPTPVFLPEGFRAPRSLAGYSPCVAKSRTRLINWAFTQGHTLFLGVDHNPLVPWCVVLGRSLNFPNP